jgi:hypothetical protein
MLKRVEVGMRAWERILNVWGMMSQLVSGQCHAYGTILGPKRSEHRKSKKRNADWPSTSNLACDHTKNQCISANQISRRIHSPFHNKIEVLNCI